MPNESIPMAGVALDTATPINAAASQDMKNAMGTEQVLKAHYEALDAREKSRLTSTIVGASQLKAYLDKNDVEGAHQFLEQRRNQLHTRMGSGENIDTQETDYALDKLRRGDVEGLKNDVASIMAAGQVYGIIGGMSGAPSNVQEWQYYNSLSPQDQQRYLTMKRSNQVVDLGDKKIIPNQANPAGTPNASFDVGLKPEDQPTNAFNKNQAASAGTASGTGIGDATNKLADMQAQLPRLREVVTKLGDLSKTATYTAIGEAVNEAYRQAGQPVPQGAIDKQAYVSIVDNEVLPLLRQTFGAAFTAEEGNRLRNTLGDPTKSPPEKQAVLTAFIEQKIGEIETLKRRTGQSGQPTGGGQKVNVINKQTGESFMIDANDLAAAQAEGFERQ